MEYKTLVFRGARRVRGIERWWREVPHELKRRFGGQWLLTGGKYWTTVDGPIAGRGMWTPEPGDMLFKVREYWYPGSGRQTYYLLRRYSGQRVYIECWDGPGHESVACVHEPGVVPEDMKGR